MTYTTTVSTSAIVGPIQTDGNGVYWLEYYAIDETARNMALYNLRAAVGWALFALAASGKITVEISAPTEVSVQVYDGLELRRLEITARIEEL